MVLWEGMSYPGLVIRCRLIGVLAVEQTNVETGARERNDRLMAIPIRIADAGRAAITSIFDVDSRTRAALEQFFLHAVAFEGKDLKLLGWSDAENARAILARSKAASTITV